MTSHTWGVGGFVETKLMSSIIYFLKKYLNEKTGYIDYMRFNESITIL